ncbi:Intradiol ring-cleavage dioxygenase [Echria macrotheca]|uniref:Intradiol ring-cleavage dioxygenase n=1 Tax=Echria macrotheca TaxID=438768 RepID=A0AAJ0BE85_9PEZI|nr:Intradiol ring-cleavage dioxygenase [Echria macrotheca]
MYFSSVLAGVLAAVTVSAHPGHDPAVELAEREAALSQFSRRDLAHCADKIRERGLEARSIARRNALVTKLQKRANLETRDLASLLNTTHLSPHNYTLQTPEEVLFGSNRSCVLSPEVTEGPYYVAGEYIRSNIIEEQAGVPLTLDLQVIDIDTCEPLSGAYLEIWHCNSTGVYGGVSAAGNGNSDTDKANLNATWLRGAQQTSPDGVAEFETVFPGHYIGRATHIHVMVHQNATLSAKNGTIHGTRAAHVGQVYFDQDLIAAVEREPPYRENEQALTTNVQDFLLAQGAAVGDPIVQYVMLGDGVGQGLLAWIAFGVNTTLGREVVPAVTLTEEGGVPNANPGFPGGGAGGAPFPFPFPSGVPFPPGFGGGPGPVPGGAPTGAPVAIKARSGAVKARLYKAKASLAGFV